MTARWLGIAACIAIAGCSDGEEARCAVSETGPVTSMLDGPVDFVSAGGQTGRGDGTALHIDPDGTMTRTTRTSGTRTTRLDAATIGALRTQIDTANFPTLESSYINAPDDFTYEVSVDLAGMTYHVSIGEMTRDLPARLSTLVIAFGYLLRRPICE
jgi:hypothetical protein